MHPSGCFTEINFQVTGGRTEERGDKEAQNIEIRREPKVPAGSHLGSSVLLNDTSTCTQDNGPTTNRILDK